MDAASTSYGKCIPLSHNHPGRTVTGTSVIDVEDLGPLDDPADSGHPRTIEMGNVSDEAPLAAFHRHHAGDRVRIQMPKGPRLYKIIRIG